MDPIDELFTQFVRQRRRSIARLEKNLGNATNNRAESHPVDENLTMMLTLGIIGEVFKSGLLNVTIIGIYDSGLTLA